VLFLYFVLYAVFQKQNSISENGLVSILGSFCWSEFSRCLIKLQKTDLVSRMLCCFLEHYMMDKVQIPIVFNNIKYVNVSGQKMYN